MKKLIYTAVLSLWAFSFVNSQTVMDVISNSPDHNTLEQVLTLSGLDGALETGDSLTVFAPTDDAFDAVDSAALAEIVGDPDLLEAVLLYHVLGFEALSTDLEDGMEVTTLQGQDVTVTINADGVFINDAQVTVADLTADNGVVHVIDAVLVPAEDEPFTVFDIIEDSDMHTTLTSVLELSGLDAALSDPEGTFTVFAPTDDAFDAVDSTALAEIVGDPDLLEAVLLYHVLGFEALSTDLTDGMEVTTLQGDDVTVTINADGVFINDAQVTVADLTADNGVVHVIDAVLVPAEDEPFTVFDIIDGSDDHLTLTAVLELSGLDAALSDPEGTFTVFAPTDDAFDAVDSTALAEIVGDPDLLEAILLYHVLGFEALSTDLADGMEVTTLQGDDVTVTINANGVFINDAQVTVADLTADNGVVHVIDAVLVPEEDEPFTVFDIIDGSDDHLTLTAVLELSGLDAALSDPEGTFTVFAPTDDAFDAVDSTALAEIVGDPDLLEAVLLYHVLGFEALSTDLEDGMEVTTLQGQDVTVTINADGVFINDAQVTVADLTADNGVVHVIDAVLVPAEDEPFTVFDIIDGSDDHLTLTAVLELSGLDAALSDPEGTFTVFAPTDDAFEAVDSTALAEIVGDPDLLEAVLLYHVLGFEALSTNLEDGMEVTTLQGDDVTVTINADGVFINDAQVTVADLTADNGVAHVIDAVLVPAEDEPFTVFDIIDGSDDHLTLTAVLELSGLDAALSDPEGTFTVFAPSDDAFDAVDSTAMAEIVGDPDLLEAVLLYHVVGFEALSTDLEDGMEVTTLQGDDVTVTINADGVFINDAQVTVADLTADNGVVHVIDAVLVPAEDEPFTVADIIINSPDHTILTTAVMEADLVGALSDPDAELTVFAPTDNAFDALPDGALEELLSDPEGALTEVLLYHVAGTTVFSTDLEDGMTITTLQGDEVSVSIMNGNVMINDAMVTIADLTADNGVVHVIDAVLLPPTSTRDLTEMPVSIYPNPASSRLQVNLDEAFSGESYRILIFDAMGRLVRQKDANGITTAIDVSGLPGGTFTLFIENGQMVSRSLFVIK